MNCYPNESNTQTSTCDITKVSVNNEEKLFTSIHYIMLGLLIIFFISLLSISYFKKKHNNHIHNNT